MGVFGEGAQSTEKEFILNMVMREALTFQLTFEQ